MFSEHMGAACLDLPGCCVLAETQHMLPLAPPLLRCPQAPLMREARAQEAVPGYKEAS